MKPITVHTGTVAPLDRVNVDTDQIIPAVYLKRIERTGYGPFLFAAWRFLEDGSPNPEFVLNQAPYQRASILVTGRNFGSGSSREHAPWALLDYGFRAILAPSFADIFHKNCFNNGLIPVLLPEDQLDVVMRNAKEVSEYSLTIDLEACQLRDQYGFNVVFRVHQDSETHDFRRRCLLEGLDEIDLILEHEDKILAYERTRDQATNSLTSDKE